MDFARIADARFVFFLREFDEFRLGRGFVDVDNGELDGRAVFFVFLHKRDSP